MNRNPPRVEQKSLPLEIQAATRSCHTVLNRSITSRLPLCLPPNAATPAVYAGGMACFGRIYFLFEHVWEELLTCMPGNTRIHDALKQLKLPSLFRSARLRADLSLFDQRLGGQAESYKKEDDELAALLDRTREAILKKPLLIMSYTWVMYLALFNGGRWIRAQLEQAGPEFWVTQVHTQSSKMDCLSFWNSRMNLTGKKLNTTSKQDSTPRLPFWMTLSVRISLMNASGSSRLALKWSDGLTSRHNPSLPSQLFLKRNPGWQRFMLLSRRRVLPSGQVLAVRCPEYLLSLRSYSWVQSPCVLGLIFYFVVRDTHDRTAECVGRLRSQVCIVILLSRASRLAVITQ